MSVDWDNIEPHAWAVEVHEKFWKKMEPNGAIDKILAGIPPGETIPPVSDEEISLIRRQVDIQMAEYEAAIDAAVSWHGDWNTRRPKGFRASRRKSASEAAE